MPVECRLPAIIDGAAVKELTSWEYIAFGLIFLWSGFVLSELGFWGAALALPLRFAYARCRARTCGKP